LLWGGRRLPAAVFRVAFLLTVVLSLLASTAIIGTPRGAMFAYWWAFALGAVTWWTLRGGPLWVFAVALVIVLSSPLAEHADWRWVGALTASLLLAASRLGTMGKWLSDRVSQFFGHISYSLYLFHPIIGWSAQSFALRHFNQSVALALGVGVSIVAAWLAYVIIERPAMNLSRRVPLRASRPTPAAACAALDDR
jgi:peptidoglycan/LPS O-acetylase OafA/YrhL